MKAAAIIGGGPAGCQCALWLYLLGYDVVLIEKNKQLGGLQGISPYINNWMIGTLGLTGHEIATHIHRHIQQIQIPVLLNSTVTTIKRIKQGFEILINDHKLIQAHHLVISTGVQSHAGHFQSSDKVIIGPGKKIAEFAFENKKVAILGGGDSAAENYVFIKKKQAQQCHLYARTIKARQNLLIPIHSQDLFIGNYLADQSSMTITHQEMRRSYDVFVVLYGWEANIPTFLGSFKQKLLADKKFIITNKYRQTKVSRIFAAGEVTHYTHPCVTTAMADGVIVAKTIQKNLERIYRNKTT